MQKRTIYSLLLISFTLVFAGSLAFGQTVDIQSKTVAKCESSGLSITVDTPNDAMALEIVLEVSGPPAGAFLDAMSVVWDAGFGYLTGTGRVVDLSGADGETPDTVRIAAMLIDPGDACLPAGETLVAQLNFTANAACDGVATVGEGTFDGPLYDIESQFVDCVTMALVPAAVNAGTVTITNTAPTIDPVADATVHFDDTYTGLVVGHDIDGCETLTYSKVSGPVDLEVDEVTGVITWVTTGADVGNHVVEVAVSDACDASVSTSFNICVENTPPVITCPADTLIALGDDLSVTVTAIDDDSGPAPLLFELLSFDGPGAATLDPATGVFEWSTLLDESYKGIFTATVKVTDGANTDFCSPENADTCSFEIKVVNFLVTIQKTEKTPQGQEVLVDVTMQDSNFENYPMGGFDFLIQYDPSALVFQYADQGQFLTDCGWEYFTYRYGPAGNCGANACPSGFLRISAIAETNNGPIHPTCFTNSDPATSNQLAQLHFMVTNDRTFECMYIPIRFYWYDCGDNTISDVDGNQLFISNRIFNFEDTLGVYSGLIADPTVEFPSAFGANYTCDVALEDGKPDPLRFIDFVNGGVDIVCADSIDARGDLNLNEIPYEIADAVLYSNYFVYGLSVFTVMPEGQIAASDVNADGLTLSVADLVYLIRVVIGDATAYPKVVTPVEANYIHANNGMVAINGDVQIGAAYMVVEGDVSPELRATNMDMLYNFDGVNTRVLVYSLEGETFTGEMASVNGNIISIEMANFEGNPIAAKLIPAEFALNQNYPNPFNPTTTINFALPMDSDYNLDIYNVNGQRVASFNGSHEAGVVEIEWEASNYASGIYFYKLTAGSFTDTKKMVLLK